MDCDLNWDAIGAIGQWAGALFTAAAVWVALIPYWKRYQISFETQILVDTDDELNFDDIKPSDIKIEWRIVLTNVGLSPFSARFGGVFFQSKGSRNWQSLPMRYIPESKMLKDRGERYEVLIDRYIWDNYAMKQPGKLKFEFQVMGKRVKKVVKTPFRANKNPFGTLAKLRWNIKNQKETSS